MTVLKDTRSLAVIAIIANTLDWLSTRIALSQGFVEGNPLLIPLMGGAGFEMYKLGVVSGFLAAIYWIARDWPRFSQITLIALISLYTFAVVNNALLLV